MQQESKSDVNGNLLQSFRNMDVTTGPAGTPRSTANTGKSEMPVTQSASCQVCKITCIYIYIYIYIYETSYCGMASWLAKQN